MRTHAMTDDELDERLRAWYRTEVGEDETASSSLRRDVAAIPRAPSRPARRFGRGRGITLLAAAALLLVGGAVAAGSGLLRLPSLVPPEPVPSLAVVPTPSPAEQSSRPIISPSPTPDNAFPARSGMFDAVRAVLLASDTVGWVSTASAVYRTRDMGKTWTEVRPPGWSATATTRFVDADTMYVASQYVGSDGGPVAIVATHDGGTSWVEATIDGPPRMAGMVLSFRTPDSGTATFFTADGKDLRVFETADGGRTWTGPVRSSAPRMLYLLKDLDLYRSGDRALVLSNAVAPGTPFDNNVYLSMDGGVTWIKRPFPTGDHARAADMKGVAGLWADGSGRIVLAMDIYGDVQIYTSGDDGRSWQFVRDLGHEIAKVQLLSATEWVVLARDGSEVLSTVDGGGHWRQTFGPTIFFYEASFASPDHGWAVLNCYYYPAAGPDPWCAKPQPGVYDKKDVFFATSDGGQTWTRIGG
jgi:photosystem II stability/assembly factor-like uncharacterized protein